MTEQSIQSEVEKKSTLQFCNSNDFTFDFSFFFLSFLYIARATRREVYSFSTSKV